MPPSWLSLVLFSKTLTYRRTWCWDIRSALLLWEEDFLHYLNQMLLLTFFTVMLELSTIATISLFMLQCAFRLDYQSQIK